MGQPIAVRTDFLAVEVRRLARRAAERKAALAYEREQKRVERERAKEEATRQKDRERHQQAIDKAQATLDRPSRSRMNSRLDRCCQADPRARLSPKAATPLDRYLRKAAYPPASKGRATSSGLSMISQ